MTIRESYIVLAMGSLINISFVDWASTENNEAARLNLMIAYLLCAFCIFYPLIQQGCLYKNKLHLKNKTFKARFGAAYEGLKEVDGEYITYELFFFYRRMLIITCVIYFDSSLITQFITVVVSGLAVVMLLSLRRPFKSPSRNRVEILEECAIMVTMYHIFCFTEFVPEPIVKHYIGYSLVACTLLHLAVYLSVKFSFWLKSKKRAIKVICYKRNARKSLKSDEMRPGKTWKIRRAVWIAEELDISSVELSSSSSSSSSGTSSSDDSDSQRAASNRQDGE